MSPKRTFGQLARLPSARFRARYTGPDGRLHNAPCTFVSAEEAEDWLAGEQRLIRSGRWSSPASRDTGTRGAVEDGPVLDFATYAQVWLDRRRDVRPSTRAGYKSSIDRHLVPRFGATPLEDIDAAAVRAWFASYGERTPTARAHAYAVLAAVMARAVDEGVIAQSPCHVARATHARTRREPRVLTLAELLALADAMPERHRALTLVCGLCGLRFGEAVALRRRDVELDRALLHVTRTAVRAGGEKTTDALSTAAARRTVALPRMVVDALRTHLARHPVAGPDALLFPGRDGRLLAPSSLHGRPARVEHRGIFDYRKEAYGFVRARESIGRPDLHWHDLRRTAASLGARAGATAREMQSRLGHTTPAFALRYQQTGAERDRAVADRMQQLLEAEAAEGAPSSRTRGGT